MAESWTTRRLRTWIAGYLADRRVDAPGVCADLLLGHALSCERMQLYMHPDRPATPSELAVLRGLVKRAGEHEPVQFLVGRWGFHGLELEVSPATLIPRPCTETLVEAALAHLRDAGLLSADAGRPAVVLDLCTGTGCIALAIARAACASRRPRRSLAWTAAGAPRAAGGAVDAAGQPAADATDAVTVIATDLVEGAVALARRNAARLGLSAQVRIEQCDLDDAVPAHIAGAAGADLICANPPYVTASEWDGLDRNVRDHEPRSALVGGTDGLDVVRRIVELAPRRLRPGGMLLCEIGATQGDAVRALAEASGLRDARILTDHEGLPRVLQARS